MYLAIATRPDISYAIGVISRHLENPSKSDVASVKRILKYIKGSTNFGILFSNNVKLSIVGYSDADYASDVETRCSTSGYLFTLGSGVISWCSEKQKCVALSATESEYIAASEAIRELVWFKRLILELLPDFDEVPEFRINNQSAIKLMVFHKRTKHIDVRYNFIRKIYDEKMFIIKYVPSNEQIADVFTKALPKGQFENLRKKMDVYSSDNWILCVIFWI